MQMESLQDLVCPLRLCTIFGKVSIAAASRSYICVQVQERQGSFSALRNLLFPANRALYCYNTDAAEAVCPNRQRS